MRGISATQVVQLVAQKLTSVTLPFMSAVVLREPSSNTNVSIRRGGAAGRHEDSPGECQNHRNCGTAVEEQVFSFRG